FRWSSRSSGGRACRWWERMDRRPIRVSPSSPPRPATVRCARDASPSIRVQIHFEGRSRVRGGRPHLMQMDFVRDPLLVYCFSMVFR
ncbi:hypothetical protein PMAYCL1PPCAC_24729, partial [Pristionchus mayeri]